MMRANWFETFFQGITIDLWRGCASPELTSLEADFLASIFPKGARLLDIPCGNGRLALELARRGFGTVGLDLSKDFVAEASQQSSALTLKTQFHLGDMRSLGWTAEFDGAYCWGNSFGYLEYPDMEKFVAGVARALRPGSRFVVDSGMTAASIIPNLKDSATYQVGDITFK